MLSKFLKLRKFLNAMLSSARRENELQEVVEQSDIGQQDIEQDDQGSIGRSGKAGVRSEEVRQGKAMQSDAIYQERNIIDKQEFDDDIDISMNQDDTEYIDEVVSFKNNIRIYNIYGSAIIVGQIAYFGQKKSLVVLTGNQPTVMRKIILDGQEVQLSELGEKVRYINRLYENKECYCIEIVKPYIKPYSRLEFDIQTNLSLECLGAKALQDYRVKNTNLLFYNKHGMVQKTTENVENFLYYLSLYFGMEKIFYNNKIDLTVDDFEYWKVRRKIVNVDCRYVDLDGNNVNYLHDAQANIIRKIVLPFICDLAKVKEIVKRYLQEEFIIAFVTKDFLDIKRCDELSVEIGYLRYKCYVLEQIVVNKGEVDNCFRQKVLAKIVSDSVVGNNKNKKIKND